MKSAWKLCAILFLAASLVAQTSPASKPKKAKPKPRPQPSRRQMCRH